MHMLISSSYTGTQPACSGWDVSVINVGSVAGEDGENIQAEKDIAVGTRDECTAPASRTVRLRP